MNKRCQVISRFSNMVIDMDYMLCIPSVHAMFNNESITMDYSGGIREISPNFPPSKVVLLKKWVLLHKNEIEGNHMRCGHNEFPLMAIEPLDEPFN